VPTREETEQQRRVLVTRVKAQEVGRLRISIVVEGGTF
jgi:hypothetical protein